MQTTNSAKFFLREGYKLPHLDTAKVSQCRVNSKLVCSYLVIFLFHYDLVGYPVTVPQTVSWEFACKKEFRFVAKKGVNIETSPD